jgi:iron-sulfur cluster repair protein YtfE (RIC family)
MDAIVLLKDDHKRVASLFGQFKKTTDRAVKTRARLVNSMIEELSVHAVIEEQVFYPAVRSGMPAMEDDVLEAIEEHHIVKWTLSELDGLEPQAENFGAKVLVLIENVSHHVKEEEGTLFPAVRKAFTKAELLELGDKLEAARMLAPKRPHPKAPSQPPAQGLHDFVADSTEKAVAIKDKIAARLSANAGD